MAAFMLSISSNLIPFVFSSRFCLTTVLGGSLPALEEYPDVYIGEDLWWLGLLAHLLTLPRSPGCQVNSDVCELCDGEKTNFHACPNGETVLPNCSPKLDASCAAVDGDIF